MLMIKVQSATQTQRLSDWLEANLAQIRVLGCVTLSRLSGSVSSCKAGEITFHEHKGDNGHKHVYVDT